MYYLCSPGPVSYPHLYGFIEIKDGTLHCEIFPVNWFLAVKEVRLSSEKAALYSVSPLCFCLSGPAGPVCHASHYGSRFLRIYRVLLLVLYRDQHPSRLSYHLQQDGAWLQNCLADPDSALSCVWRYLLPAGGGRHHPLSLIHIFIVKKWDVPVSEENDSNIFLSRKSLSQK